ncbi:MAG: hypothetical protein V4488_09330 [Pseudomonadota bacterium]
MSINETPPSPANNGVQNADATAPALAMAASELGEQAAAERIAARTQQSLRQAVDKIACTAAAAAESLCQSSEKLHLAQQRLLDDCRIQVRKKPIESILVAAVAGYLLSQLFRQKR